MTTFILLLPNGATVLNQNASTLLYTAATLTTIIIEVFLNDVNDPPMAKPVPSCCFPQAKLADDVEKVKQAAVKHPKC